ncbi:unnamed protein product [Leptidea sinapis]|uniref:Uncharacterized protein n=1 Tax=Leptidea sinapis TaxID=189913 RepID=A0A5E4QNM5_9NEOP|nr:unnamed protein product [Leptidea sinapis]
MLPPVDRCRNCNRTLVIAHNYHRHGGWCEYGGWGAVHTYLGWYYHPTSNTTVHHSAYPVAWNETSTDTSAKPQPCVALC